MNRVVSGGLNDVLINRVLRRLATAKQQAWAARAQTRAAAQVMLPEPD
jgi:hypothetical protein